MGTQEMTLGIDTAGALYGLGVWNDAGTKVLSIESNGGIAVGSYANETFPFAAPADGLAIPGSVGIGTTIPGAKLHVAAGDIKLDAGYRLKETGRYNLVHTKPVFGGSVGGHAPARTASATFKTIAQVIAPFGAEVPAAASGATRFYRLFVEFGDNVATGDAADLKPRIRLVRASDGVTEIVPEQTLTPVTDTASPYFTAAYTGYFQTTDTANALVQARIATDAGTNPNGRYVEIRNIRIEAYDVF
jgi:hypothetical protein